MAQYNPLSGETIYDISLKLYNDLVSGVADLLNLNPGIDIDADLFGVPLTYQTLPKRIPPVIIHPPTPTVKEVYLVRESQSVYDLAVQLYGTVSNIGKLLENFPNLNEQVPFNSPVDLVDQSDPVVTFFKGKVVATFIELANTTDELRITNAGFRIINTGDFRKVAA